MASLKDQLDQAGYDTSTLDEAAVLKQLSDAGYDVSAYSAPSQGIMGAVGNAVKNLLPSKETLEAPMTASKKLGTMVEAGGAGIGDIDANLLPRAANLIPGVNMKTEPFLPAVQQAGTDVENVMKGLAPETAAGKAGKFVGSFFTPNQIAMQAIGGAAAEPIVAGLGKIATPVSKFAVNAFPKVSNFLGAAPEAVSALAENPEAVSEAASLPEMAETVAGKVKGLGESGIEAAQAGKAALSDTTPVVGLKDKLMNYAANLANSSGADEADQAAADYVTKYAKNLDLNPSELDVKELIEKMDDKINTKFEQANPTMLTEAKKAIRQTLNEALTAQNPAYAKAMAEASGTFAPQETLSKAFSLKEGAPSDATIQALRNKANPEALATQKALSTTFPGLAQNIGNSAAKAALQQNLLGKLGLFGAPKLGPAIAGAIKGVPATGNAVYQGLTQ
jgi:hypothetical protein